MVSHLLQFCAVHPFVVLLISVGLLCILFYKVNKKYLLISTIAWLLPAFGVANFIWGSDWNGAYVNKNGEKGIGTVIRIEPTHTWINRVQQVQYICLIKTRGDRTINASFLNNDAVFYPSPGRWIPPQPGGEFAVKYIPGHESNFIILTNDRGSDWSNKRQCTQMMQKIASAKAVYNSDPSNRKNKNIYLRLIRQYLKAPCDPDVQKAYTLLLERIESGEL